jgi:hypothetical protein
MYILEKTEILRQVYPITESLKDSYAMQKGLTRAVRLSWRLSGNYLYHLAVVNPSHPARH